MATIFQHPFGYFSISEETERRHREIIDHLIEAGIAPRIAEDILSQYLEKLFGDQWLYQEATHG